MHARSTENSANSSTACLRKSYRRLALISAVTFAMAFSTGLNAGVGASDGKSGKPSDGGSTPPSFNADIRPILVKNCYACHGDASELQGNVLLKTFEDATGGSGYEAAIIPGDSANSPLIKRISEAHEELRMPPLETGKQLSAEQIATLAAWIDAGAKYEKHWAYQPLRRPAVPRVADQQLRDWQRNSIDAFIAKSMENTALRPSPVASDQVLTRRMSLDLHGLAPGYDKVLANTGIGADDKAYQTYLESLFASEHYGERMALTWLDWVKYSDEISNIGDYYSPFYLYRNYVIDAFNQNKAFDDFTREQIAGDLLPGADDQALIASAYNHLVVRIQDGVGKEAIHKYITERVDKIGQVWLASSLECAQCHDHKFDPFLQKDYYQIGAYFSDIDRVGVWSSGVSGDATEPRSPDSYFKWPQAFFPTPAQQRRLNEIAKALEQEREDFASAVGQANEKALLKGIRQAMAADEEYLAWHQPIPQASFYQDGALLAAIPVEEQRAAGGNAAIAAKPVQYVLASEAEQAGNEMRVRLPIEHQSLRALQLRLSTERGTPRLISRDSQGGPVLIQELSLVRIDENGEATELAIAAVESTDLSLNDESLLIDGDTDASYRVAPEDVFHFFRYERKDDMELKGIHNEVFLTLSLAQPLNAKGESLELRIRFKDANSTARKLALAYSRSEIASPFQHLAAGPINTAAWQRKLRQWVFDIADKYVFGSDFMDFTGSKIFTWMATNSGISSPVPYNDVMKSVLATIKDKTAWEEFYREHVLMRLPAFAHWGNRIRRLEREQEKLWGEVERVWVSRSATARWNVKVLERGDPQADGPEAARKLPSFLVANEGERADGKEQTRLDLANWLVSDDNPLTARVIVNRIWRMFMGEGLVATVEDFGSGGAEASHPELLDWLAAEFVESGWDVQHMVRLIMQSATYRQSSIASAEHLRLDPENHFYARQNHWQIDAEFIQDNLLQFSGLLRPGIGGRHTVHGAEDNAWADDQYRRSLYLLRKNREVPAQLKVFGAKPRVHAVIERPQSITPLQALAGLNQPLMHRVATSLSEELRGMNASDRQKLQWLYRRVLARSPSDEELALGLEAKTEVAESEQALSQYWLTQVRSVLNVREVSLRS